MADKNADKKNQVAVLNEDDSVGTLDFLKKELKAIKTITETQYRTTGVLEGFSTPIQTETKMDVLIRMYASVISRERLYNEAQGAIADQLGTDFPAPVFKMSNFSGQDFLGDIILRVKVLTVEDRKKELEGLIKEGEKFLTEKDQKKIWLNKINKFSGKTLPQLDNE